MAYMVNAVKYNKPVVYVSSVEANGIPVGDNTNPGTIDAPFLTVDVGIGAISSGGTVYVNGTSEASPTTYILSSGMNLAISCTIRSAVPGQRIFSLSGTGTTKVMAIAGSGISVTLQDAVLDAANNVGGAAQSVIELTTQSSAYDLTLSNVEIKNWTTNYGLYQLTSAVKVNLSMTDVTLSTASAVKGGAYLPTMAAGSVALDTVTCSPTITTAGIGALHFEANAAGITAGVSATATDVTCEVTLDAAATSNPFYGMRFGNMPFVITGGTFSVAPGGSSGRVANVVGGESTAAVTMTITGATVANTTTGGLGIYTSNDNSNRVTRSVGTITGNTVAAGRAHAIFPSNLTTGSTCNDNTITSGALGVVVKWSDHVVADGNIISGTNSPLIAKGAPDTTFSDNDVTLDSSSGVGSALGVYFEEDGAGVFSTDGTVSGNTFDVTGGPGRVYVRVEAGNDATFANNVYNLTSGSLSGQPWRDQGVNYTTLAGWQAIEPTATGTAP